MSAGYMGGGNLGAAVLTAETLHHVTKHLPSFVQKAFSYVLKLKFGSLTVQLPDGERYRYQAAGAGPDADFIIHNYSFARRLFEAGDIGIADAYIAKEWDTPDLTKFLMLFCVNHEAVQTLLPGRPFVRLYQRFRHWLNRNSKSGSKRNIHAHYDLGNAFYSAWLDKTMTYSSAIYAEGDNDLASAQARKYRSLALLGGFKPGDHILEIGCGWGGFAEFAAKEMGCKVTCLTISKEQLDFAQQRIQNAGLGEQVKIRFQDYRDETGTYDRVASIEMFEAVGEEYWPTFFKQVHDRLRPGGTASIQTITIQERLFENYRREIDFIRHFIFPGGMLPSPERFTASARVLGLTQTADRVFGVDYARTLSEWRDRFLASWPQLTELGFDERFNRMWRYYLSYCEAGFLSGNIDVRQVAFARNS
jgi:cyclopropane-fatty-acyl-phospholipid synthase